MTVEPATAPNSGVSLEVGATYRHPRLGETVVYGDKADKDGLVPVFFVESDLYGVADPDLLVRVVPTPADRWLTFNADGELTGVHDTPRGAERWARPDGMRVARFVFAGWVGEQSDDLG